MHLTGLAVHSLVPRHRVPHIKAVLGEVEREGVAMVAVAEEAGKTAEENEAGCTEATMEVVAMEVAETAVVAKEGDWGD